MPSQFLDLSRYYSTGICQMIEFQSGDFVIVAIKNINSDTMVSRFDSNHQGMHCSLVILTQEIGLQHE
jgi:pyruvate/2-oxoglutarate/acetoin dehydrogenase E1 component